MSLEIKTMIFAVGISSQNKPCLFMSFSPITESEKNLNWKGPLNGSIFFSHQDIQLKKKNGIQVLVW